MNRLRSDASAWSTEVSGSATRNVPILVPSTTTGSVRTRSLPVSSVEIVVNPSPAETMPPAPASPFSLLPAWDSASSSSTILRLVGDGRRGHQA